MADELKATEPVHVLQELMSLGEDVFLRTFHGYEEQVQSQQIAELQEKYEVVTRAIKLELCHPANRGSIPSMA